MRSSGELKALTTLEAGVLIPGLQAGITGALVGVIGGTLAWIGGGDALKWSLLSGAISGLLALWAGFSAWRSAIYQANQQPEPVKVYPVEAARLSLSIDWDEGRAGIFEELQISDEMFITWGKGVASGRSLGENHWTGAKNPFSKGQYHAMLDRLIFLGMVRQAGKGRTSGFELTGKGRAVCNAILARYRQDSPTGVRYLTN